MINVQEAGPTSIVDEGDEISFGQLFSTIWSSRTLIAKVSFAAALASVAIAFLIPAEYTAEVVILTPQQAESSWSAMAQAAGVSTGGALSGLGLLSAFGMRSPSDLYIGILESRTIADTLITKFHLKDVYHDKYLQTARKHLASRTAIKAGKDTLIHITVEDRDARRAADLANAYVEQLSIRNSKVALTEAGQRRLFFELQVAKERELLTIAEDALKKTQQVTGLLVPTGQAEAMLRAASQLRAEVLSRQAQLAGLKTFVSEDNPNYQSVKQQIASLQSELSALEKGGTPNDLIDLPVGKLPQAALEYIRRYREVRYHESLFEALAKQYEAAKLDEAKASPLVQVIDAAVVPEKKSWPPRLIIILGVTLLAAFCANLWTLRSPGPAAR
jgi:uncharacterized protein involved in exopolysaccharide biosynthesis